MAGDKGRALPATPGRTAGEGPPAEPVLLFSYQTLILVK